jgi:aspartate kinase
VSIQTELERRRGVSKVELRAGYAQVHVSRLPGPLMDERLKVLRAVANANVSIEFLKMTQTGASFLVPESDADRVSSALTGIVPHFTIRPNRSIVMVHAVNMRDEEGLLARIVSEAIQTGAKIDHLGDMHDRTMIVAESADAAKVAERIESHLMKQ